MLDFMVPASKLASVTESGYYVMGKKATLNEYNVALALEHERIGFLFQYWHMGGTEVLGGYVLDFLLTIPPRWLPLEVFGEYWHSGAMASGDRYKISVLTQQFRQAPVIIWGSESNTYEDALSAVRRKVR